MKIYNSDAVAAGSELIPETILSSLSCGGRKFRRLQSNPSAINQKTKREIANPWIFNSAWIQQGKADVVKRQVFC
jgi:hypothetical protein